MNRLDDFLGCPRSEQNADRIAGYRMDQDERNQTDPEKNGDHLNRSKDNEIKTMHDL